MNKQRKDKRYYHYKQVNWDGKTQTVYVGEIPKVVYNSCRPSEFLKRHKPYVGSEFDVYGPGTVEIRQEKFDYFNFVNGFTSGIYLINGNYTKIKGIFLNADNGHGSKAWENLVVYAQAHNVYNFEFLAHGK